ncbi:MAG: acid stress protein IbaG [Sodalis sp. Fle]|nr:MAG: acid stress protein IbaG [Sodalis sp. Fle]
METYAIKDVLIKALRLDQVHVSGNGRHFQVIAVSKQFAGMSKIKKQQIIYAPLMEYISDDRIHSLSIKAYTPEEWQCARKLNSF